MTRLVFAMCVLAACGGGSSKATPDGGHVVDGAGSGTGPISLDDFEAAYVKMICTKEFACCTPAELGSATEQTCESQFTAATQTGFTEEKQLIAAGKLTYDPVIGGTCLDFDYADSCADFFGTFERLAVSDQCKNLFVPLVADGADCTTSSECVNGNCVGYDEDDMTTGMCMPSQVGSQCDETCGNGLYCDTNMTCRAKKADGAACVGGNECTGNACTNSMCAEVAPVCVGQ